MTVIEGDVLDSAVLRRALDGGAEAVVSCLGIRRVNPANPWSPIAGVHSLVGPVAETLARLAPETAVRRVVAMSSGGVGDSMARTDPTLRWVFNHSNVRIAFDDLERMESAFASSSLDWVAVRPTRLTDGRHDGAIRTCVQFRSWSSIARGAVARWLLDVAESRAPISDRTPMITAG